MRGLRGVILLVLAAVITIIVFYVLGQPGQEVVVAAGDLPRGTTLTTEMMTLKRFLERPKGASAEPKKLEGRFLCADLTPDEPIVEAKLAPPGAGSECVTPQVVQPVAVAVRDLPRGTTLAAEMLKLQRFPEGSLPEKAYFAELKSLEGRFLCADLAPDEPVVEAKLAPPGVGLECVTRRGKRAMAVRVDPIVGVAGFIKPGNRVDVVVTLKQSDPVTKIVLQNIVVLAAGTEIERKGKEREPSVVQVITLEVGPEEAEKLALASSQGELRLALRSFHDEKQEAQPVLTPGATLPMLVPSYGVQKEQGKKQKAVELLKGGQVETVTLEK